MEPDEKYRFECYSKRPAYWSYDGIPFVSVYVAAVAVLVSAATTRGEVLADHFLVLLVPAVLHVFLFLATQWSVEVNCLVRFKQEKQIESASCEGGATSKTGPRPKEQGSPCAT